MSDSKSNFAAIIREHNRSVGGEALITLGVGLGSCIIVFGVLYWLSFIAFTMCLRGFGFGGPWAMAGIVTGVFLLASVWGAWRQDDPIAEAGIVVDDSPGREFVDAMAFSMGVPVIRREGLAGIGALFLGGPVNLFDAFALWRSRLPASTALIAEAELVLKSCASGVNPKKVRTPAAIALLYRLKLIKAVHQPGGDVLFQQTQKGMEAAANDMRQATRVR